MSLRDGTVRKKVSINLWIPFLRFFSSDNHTPTALRSYRCTLQPVHNASVKRRRHLQWDFQSSNIPLWSPPGADPAVFLKRDWCCLLKLTSATSNATEGGVSWPCPWEQSSPSRSYSLESVAITLLEGTGKETCLPHPEI